MQTGLLLPLSLTAQNAIKVDPLEEKPKVKTTRHGELTVNTFCLGRLKVNCFIVSDRNLNCIVIDPGARAEVILDFIRNNRLKLLAYVLTHSHLDHISALDECYKAMPAPVAMHPDENDWAFCEKNQWEPYYPLTKPVKIERPLKHWQSFKDGNLNYTIIHTPGHSAGSVCIWFPQQKIIFSGDTLFAGNIGRTDLHKSSFRSLLRSLGAFLALPPETKIYPGHGQTTTVKTELATNPYFTHVPDKTNVK